EILVGGHNLEPVINRNEDRADHNECEGKTKIILDKTHAALVGLPWSGEECDRARLRGHDREPDRAPANAGVAMQVMAEVMIAAGLPPAVDRDREERAEDDGVVE